MPYETFWYVENRVLYERLYGVLTIEELHALSKEALQYFETGTERVHVLLDISHLEKYPTNLSQLRSVMVEDKHPRLGWWVLIATNTFIRFIVSALSQVRSIHFRAVSSLDDAIKTLGEIDDSLKEALQQKQAERAGTQENS
jgi:hypothetical protein